MATIEEAVVVRMGGDAGLTALIGTRLFPLRVPQDADMPAIAYQKISSPKTHSHSGSSHLAQSRIQFTCEADDYATAKAVANAVRDCWDGFAGTVDGVRIDSALVQDDRDGWSEEHAAPVVRVDVMVWHYEQ